jgi:hypothetical protein
VTVSDNGVPSMINTQTFSVTVLEPAEPTLEDPVLTNGHFGFWIQGDVGPDYAVLASTNLLDWSPVFSSNAPGLPFFWSDGVIGSGPRQYYRVQLSP